jgi:hypothetical protein
MIMEDFAEAAAGPVLRELAEFRARRAKVGRND